MSSDLFYIRVGSVNGSKALLHVLTGFATEYLDTATSRSFALGLLLDAKNRVSSVRIQALTAGDPDAERRIGLADKVAEMPSSLHEELVNPEPWDTEWHKKNVPGIISSTKLVKEYNRTSEEELQNQMSEIEPLQEESWAKFMEAAWEKLHHYDLEVTVTDPKYLEHLVEGFEFPTAAYDAWRE